MYMLQKPWPIMLIMNFKIFVGFNAYNVNNTTIVVCMCLVLTEQ